MINESAYTKGTSSNPKSNKSLRQPCINDKRQIHKKQQFQDTIN